MAENGDSTDFNRVERESEEAWAAFQTYRDLGFGRSIAKVAKQHGKSMPLMTAWSAKHHWVSRARSYDRWLDEQATQAWGAEMRTMVEETNALGRELVRRGMTRLASIPDEQKIPYDVIRAAEVAAKIQREGMGSIKPDPKTIEDENGAKVDVAELVLQLTQRTRDAGGRYTSRDDA